MLLGRIDWFEAAKMGMFSIIATCLLQSLSRETLVKLRHLYIVLVLEFAGINGYMLVVN
jgi:hypothetical protein